MIITAIIISACEESRLNYSLVFLYEAKNLQEHDRM